MKLTRLRHRTAYCLGFGVRKQVFVVAALSAILCQAACGARFSIDSFGIDPANGHELGITGIIDVDVDTNQVIESSL